MSLRSCLLVGLSAAVCACGARTSPADVPSDGGPGAIDGPLACRDEDNDGYGVGRDCLGPDCDDHAAEVHRREDCDARCAREVRPGCPCEAGADAFPCYDGPLGTVGIGQCGWGFMQCRGGAWSPCEGQVTPSNEACDEVDNDCDGAVDDGVQNACGTCRAECGGRCWGPAPACEDWGERVSRVTRTPDGWLVVDESEGPGTWLQRVDCWGGAGWYALRVDANVPAGATLEVSARTAATSTKLDTAPWSVVARIPPAGREIDLVQALSEAGAEHGAALDVRVVLFPSGGASPTLHQVSLEYACDHGTAG